MILAWLACAPPGTWTVDVQPLATTTEETQDGCTIELDTFSTALANPALGQVVPQLQAWAFDLTSDERHSTGPLDTQVGDHATAQVWNMGYGTLGGDAPDSDQLVEQLATTHLAGTVTCDAAVAFDLFLHNDVAWDCAGDWAVTRSGGPTLAVEIDAWSVWSSDLEGGPLVGQDWVDADTNLDGVVTEDELEFVAMGARDPGTSGALNVLELLQQQPEHWLSCP